MGHLEELHQRQVFQIVLTRPKSYRSSEVELIMNQGFCHLPISNNQLCNNAVHTVFEMVYNKGSQNEKNLLIGVCHAHKDFISLVAAV